MVARDTHKRYDVQCATDSSQYCHVVLPCLSLMCHDRQCVSSLHNILPEWSEWTMLLCLIRKPEFGGRVRLQNRSWQRLTRLQRVSCVNHNPAFLCLCSLQRPADRDAIHRGVTIAIVPSSRIPGPSTQVNSCNLYRDSPEHLRKPAAPAGTAKNIRNGRRGSTRARP